MEKFYKITKEQAALIGKFEYAPGYRFDPFVGEQKSGEFLVDEKMLTILKGHSQIKKIDFNKSQTVQPHEIEIKEALFIGKETKKPIFTEEIKKPTDEK